MSYEAILEVPVLVVSGPAGQSFLVVQSAADLVADFGRDGDRAVIRTNGDEWLKTAGVWAATGANFWGTLLAQGAEQVDQARQAAEQAQTIAEELGDLETGVMQAQAAAEASAAQAAAAVGGVIHDTTTAGIAATVDGQFFLVKGDGTNTYALMYKNVATVATLIASYPSKTALDATLATLTATYDQIGYLTPDDIFIWKDAADNIVGRVKKATAGWDIILQALRNVDGLTISEYQQLDPSGSPVYIVDANDNILWKAPPIGAVDGTPAEVVTARGTRTSLDARLSQSLDAYGNPLDQFGAKKLRQHSFRRRKILLGEAAQTIWGLSGDSYTHNNTRFSGAMASRLVARLGDAGGGWTGFGFGTDGVAPYALGGNQPGSINGNVRGAYGVSYVGNWTKSYAVVPSPDICCANTASGADAIYAWSPAAPLVSAVDLFWIGTADGVMQYAWGTYNAGNVADPASYTFGADTNINVQGTVGNCSFAALAGVPVAGPYMLRLRRVSGTCSPAGVNWQSAATGAVVHKLGATGSRLSHWATQCANTSFALALARLGITTVSIMLGPNDQAGSITPDTFGANMGILLDAIRVGAPAADRLVVMPPENQMGYLYPMPLYKAATAPVVAARYAAFLDTQSSFGDATNPAEYGSAGAVPLFNADNLHPEPTTGGRALADAILAFIGDQ
ncbi:MAG: SGNH/GDSL hydrolase family protein [Mesorhizobium sp.]|nr:MAG: SGNH/GDSL hydrolase family protein [Mesorhizobium sp.]